MKFDSARSIMLVQRLSPLLRKILSLMTVGLDKESIALSIKSTPLNVNSNMYRILNELGTDRALPRAQRIHQACVMFNAFCKAYSIDAEGNILPTARKPMRDEEADSGSTEALPVNLVIAVTDPESVEDLVPLVLEDTNSALQLQALMKEGYVPEVINDLYLEAEKRWITKAILVKRKGVRPDN